jgi:hypothetical protein
VIEFEKIVAAADMLVADKYLRNRASIAACNHFLAKFGIVIDVDFAENHILLSQQPTGPLAVRTPARRVQRHGGLSHFELPLPPGEVFANGKLSFTQAFKPPCRLNTLVKPSFISVRAPLAPLLPLSQ